MKKALTTLHLEGKGCKAQGFVHEGILATRRASHGIRRTRSRTLEETCFGDKSRLLRGRAHAVHKVQEQRAGGREHAVQGSIVLNYQVSQLRKSHGALPNDDWWRVVIGSGVRLHLAHHNYGTTQRARQGWQAGRLDGPLRMG